MRISSRLLLCVLLFGASVSAQSPTYHLGRTPTVEEIRAWDISISPTGMELPMGRGTAKEGAPLFVSKGCAACHGANGEGGRAPTLITGPAAPTRGTMEGMDMGIQPPGLMATNAPYATVMWDYIHRAMPLGREGSLKPDEVYALTAFLLYRNHVVHGEDEVLDAQSLPKLLMPNHDGYPGHPEWKARTPRLRDYP